MSIYRETRYLYFSRRVREFNGYNGSKKRSMSIYRETRYLYFSRRVREFNGYNGSKKRSLTIIPRARVGYEVIDSQRGAKRRVGYNHLISNKREWNNCFIKNHQLILLDFADFAWLEQPVGNLMDAISQVWYNGSYTIAAKPIKTLELHYTMIQFLINVNIPSCSQGVCGEQRLDCSFFVEFKVCRSFEG